MRNSNRKTAIAAPLLLPLAALAALALTGCGKQQYEVVSTSQKQMAPGNFLIPPKVDILLAEDDSGSIKNIYNSIATQVPAFLSGLDTKGWDYHFAVTPLTTDRVMNQVVGSKYDGNNGSAWQAPYPGANQWDPLNTIASWVFSTPNQFTGFLSYDQTSNTNNAIEPGFETVRKALYNRAVGTGFLRSDAMLVILFVGNGNDTSGVTYCYDPGYAVPYENSPIYNPTNCYKDGVASTPTGTMASSFNYYKTQFQSLRPQPSQVKIYSAISPSGASCLGGTSFAGVRYQQMATTTGGQTYDICNQPVSSVLSSLSDSLHASKLLMRTHYLFITQAPEVSTVKVTKYLNGDPGQAMIIPQDPVNGWTYAGYVSNVYAIDSPVPMNLSSGYGIELHGSAKLMGDDTADVTFLPFGAQNSH